MIVIFSLVADGENSDRLIIFDLEQGHIPSIRERDDEFPEKRVRILGLSTGKWKLLKERPCAISDLQRPFRGAQILLHQKTVQPLEIRFRFQGEANTKTHPVCF